MMRNSARFARACLAVGLVVGIGACEREDRAAAGVAPPALIPIPATMNLERGSFTVDATTRLVSQGNAEVERVGNYFADLLARTRGVTLARATEQSATPDENVIRFEVSAGEGGSSEEGYSLLVSPERIVVSAPSPRGLFYGGITLWQLLTAQLPGADTSVPALVIEDAPRFPWRGLMLDVARHYMPPDYTNNCSNGWRCTSSIRSIGT
jgi:hexosaminidase